jgi:lysophospholipase L1-like esterase
MYGNYSLKRIIPLLLLIICLSNRVAGQGNYTTYYYQKASLFEKLKIEKEDIVFLGNSITDGGEWFELFGNPHIKNRGISGDIAQGVYDRLDAITCGHPSKIFLLIGINDVSHNVTADSIVNAIKKISFKISKDSPETKIYIQSVFPVNDIFGKFPTVNTKGDVVIAINRGLLKFCKESGLTYVDVYGSLKEKSGERMDPKYTNDGLHLMGDGYIVWKSILEKYIYE